jgi:flagellar hook-basal body complex protein FliE
MIAAEQARFTMNFTVKVRDKIIDAYQTIMRMQV